MIRTPAVDRYIFELPEKHRVLAECLRDYIDHSVPDVVECFKFKTPFYEHNGMLCYINFEKKSKCMVLSFIEGCRLEDKYNLLSKDTTQVKKLYFKSISEIKPRVLDYYMKQALIINKHKEKNFLKQVKRSE
jgi:hypothetical protein